MQSIHKIVKVTNNRIVIDLPPEFANLDMEVVLIPLASKESRIRDLEREIDMGTNSPVSSRSHTEIFENFKKKYECR